MKFKLEKPSTRFLRTNSFIDVFGWVFDERNGSPEKVLLIIGNRTIECHLFVRPDVADLYQLSNEKCGFVYRYKLGNGIKKINLIAVFKGGVKKKITSIWCYNRVSAHCSPVEERYWDDDANYLNWLSKQGLDSSIESFKKSFNDISWDAPLLSVVIPVFNPPIDLLKECIQSVFDQTYDKWEVCIADDSSTNLDVITFLEELSLKNKQVKVVFRDVNGHISEASNSAASIASGSYIVLLDNDDLLAKDALLYVAKSIYENKDAVVIYSDEDKIDLNGERSGPYFKPDFNKDLLFSQNVISHLGVYRKKEFDEVGGFRKGYEGSQDWDLALRITERIKPSNVVHIPEILYHWRMVETSTAHNINNKSYVIDAARRSLASYFERNSIAATVNDATLPNTFSISYHMSREFSVSIVIPTKNGGPLMFQLVNYILSNTDYENFEIIIIDHSSDRAETVNFLKKISADARVKILKYDGEFNYSKMNNYAVNHSGAEIICFLNDDIEILDKNWLRELASSFVREDIGVVGNRLLYPNYTVQHAGVSLSPNYIAIHAFLNNSHFYSGYGGRSLLNQNYLAVTGACLLTRRKLFVELKGFDEEGLAVNYNDVDYCLKVYKHNYLTLYRADVFMIHHESLTRGKNDDPIKKEILEREQAVMRKRWSSLLDNDIYHHPKLSKDYPDFRLKN